MGELANRLKPGGSVVVYGMQSGQFPAMPPKELIYRGLSLHGFWLINWIRNAPRIEIEEIYQKLGDLVADGSLSAAVEHVYPLDQFKEAFRRSSEMESQRQDTDRALATAESNARKSPYRSCQIMRRRTFNLGNVLSQIPAELPVARHFRHTHTGAASSRFNCF